MSALREVVADLEPVLPPAEIARGASGKVIRERQKYLCPEGLQKGAPGFTRQRGLERADALRRDDRNALRLSRETEELFVACRLTLPHGSEMMVFIAEEKHLPEIALWLCLNLRDAIQNGPLEVELHHDSQGFCQPGVHDCGKIEGTDLAVFNEPRKGRQRLAEFVIVVGYRVVALRRRAEGALHNRVIVEERQEDRNSLDNGRSQLWFDALPVVIEPALDGFELLPLFLGHLLPGRFVQDFERNVLFFKNCQESGGTLGLVQAEFGVEPKFEGFEVTGMLDVGFL